MGIKFLKIKIPVVNIYLKNNLDVICENNTCYFCKLKVPSLTQEKIVIYNEKSNVKSLPRLCGKRL